MTTIHEQLDTGFANRILEVLGPNPGLAQEGAKVSMKDTIKMVKALRRSFRTVEIFTFVEQAGAFKAAGVVPVDSIVFRSSTYRNAHGEKAKYQYLTISNYDAGLWFLTLVDGQPVLLTNNKVDEVIKTEINIAV